MRDKTKESKRSIENHSSRVGHQHEKTETDREIRAQRMFEYNAATYAVGGDIDDLAPRGGHAFRLVGHIDEFKARHRHGRVEIVTVIAGIGRNKRSSRSR